MYIIKGDLIDLAKKNEFDVIIHGCNCFHTFGAGIAKIINKEFPEAFKADLTTKQGDLNKLGTISFATKGPLTIVNAYTQYKHWKEKGEDPTTPLVNYDAVRKAFREIKHSFGNKGYKFGIPKIGAGLAGGDWGTIASIIDQEMQGENITLVLLEM